MKRPEETIRTHPEDEAARVKLDEILGILFLTIAVLLLVGWRVESSGAIHRMTAGLRNVVGAGMWYLIVMFGLWGFSKFRGRAIVGDWMQLGAWIALLPVFIAFLQSWDPANRELGGTLGWSLYSNLEDLTGTFSARILLAGFFAMLVVVCFDTPLTQLVASGYASSRQASGVVRPLFVVPVTLAYSAIYYGLCWLHVIVFIIIRDLVVVFELLYERLTTIEGGGEDGLALATATPHGYAATAGALPGASEAPARIPPVEVVGPRAHGSLQEKNPEAGGEDELSDSFAGDDAEEREEYETAGTDDLLDRVRHADRELDAIEESVDPLKDDELDPAELDPTDEDLRQAEAMELVLRPQRPEPAQPPREPAEEQDPEAPREADEVPSHEAGEARSPLDEVTVRTFPVSPAVEPHSALHGEFEARSARSRALDEEGREPEEEKVFTRPSADLFDEPPETLDRDDELTLRANAEKLVETLAQFRIKCAVSRITQGPTVTQYEVKPAPGVKISNIVNLSNDIAMALATAAIRIEAPIPGRSAVGIEIPNRKPIPVFFRELITHQAFGRIDSPLGFVIGKEITGRPVVADLARMPHLLVAGATGSGKSVCINTIISSLLFRSRPEEVKFILIDPKVVELALYDGIPNLVTEVITDPQDATAALRWAVLEMERRYRYLSRFAARDIRSFNRRMKSGDLASLDGRTPPPESPMPYIVVVIDELADLMMLARKEIEDAITRLAQMARAVGIHLVLATQRPSTNIITGVLKANLPSRIAFSVSSQVDSKVILDHVGAEKLLGSGDMLYSPIGQAKPIRLQGAYISEDEVRRLVEHLKTCGDPDYSNIVEEVMEPDSSLAGEGMNDEKFVDCVRIALEQGEASTSMLQRHLKIGYNRAARIIEAMEARGIISGSESGKRRKLLISAAEAERLIDLQA